MRDPNFQGDRMTVDYDAIADSDPQRMKTKLTLFTICVIGASCLAIAKSDSASSPAVPLPMLGAGDPKIPPVAVSGIAGVTF